MNLILLKDEDFVENSSTAILKDRRLEHVQNFISPKMDDKLIVGKFNGKIGEGKVIKINNEEVVLDVNLKLDPPKPLNCVLVLAMPRPLMFKRILMHICTLGIKEIHLINTRRVEKSFWQSPVLEDEKIENELILGLEQAKDTIIPKVFIHKRFKPFVENTAPDLVKKGNAVVAHPTDDPISDTKFKTGTIAIGPEGGFIDYEIEKFKEAGFEFVSLGSRILRVETAVPVAVSKLFNL